MTREDKQLLLKDLCARVPYNVWIGDECGNKWKLVGIDISTTDAIFKQIDDNFGIAPIETIKPYLRPMSSMTEDEKTEWGGVYAKSSAMSFGEFLSNTSDWLNAHHFDYRGLIGEGLALEAPEEMYNI